MRRKAVALFVLDLAFVAIFGAMLQDPLRSGGMVGRLGGAFCLVFFALAALAAAWQLVRPDTMTLDSDGFTLSGGLVWSPHKVSWRDVDRFLVHTTPRGGRLLRVVYTPALDEPGLPVERVETLGTEGRFFRQWPLPSREMADLLNRFREARLAETMPASGQGGG